MLTWVCVERRGYPEKDNWYQRMRAQRKGGDGMGVQREGALGWMQER